MSIQAMTWVLMHSPATGTDRLVLLALANHAGGDDWESWPGIELIRHEAALERRRTVTDALTRLVKAGAISRVVNGAPDTRMANDRRPNLYRVLRPADCRVCLDVTCPECGVRADVTPRHDAPASNGVSSESRTAHAPATDKPSLNRQGTENTLVLVTEHQRAEAMLDTPALDFAAFWSEYPRKVGKEAARKAFAKAAKLASSSVIVEGAVRFAHDPNLPPAQFVPHPATWLAGGRWDDEPLPPRAAAPGTAKARVITDRDAPSGRLEM